MDQQYVDMYLRKKRGMVAASSDATGVNNATHIHHYAASSSAAAAAPAAAAAAPCVHHHHQCAAGAAGVAHPFSVPIAHTTAAPSGAVHVVDRQVDAVLRSAAGVQRFVDRADDLSEQVDTFEDKLSNLAKLVKVSQAVSDEKEADLRQQNSELRARLKRQENVTLRLEREVEALRAAQQRQEAAAGGTIVAAVTQRIDGVEGRLEAFESALAELVATFKDSCRQAEAQQRDLSGVATALKELAEAHEGARAGLAADLLGVKEWAARNLTRLKKHVDLTTADLGALRESHVESSAQLQRVQARADSEHERLLALLQQKSREANLLTDIVDKEIQSIHAMTQQHRAGLGQRLVTPTGGEGDAVGSSYVGGSADAEGRSEYHRSRTVTTTTSAHRGGGSSSTVDNGGKKRSLYEELAFTADR